jgi:hypothetical protein
MNDLFEFEFCVQSRWKVLDEKNYNGLLNAAQSLRESNGSGKEEGCAGS